MTILPERTGAKTLPIVDITGVRVGDKAESEQVVQSIRAACLDKGFFYCTGHGVDPALMAEVFQQSARFFQRPADEKLRLDKANSQANRGYEAIRGQTLEPGMPPDLKEGYYIGLHVDPEDERTTRHINTGPNVWPSDMPEFKTVMLDYYSAMQSLSNRLLQALAMSLDKPADYFDPLVASPLATLRLLHYPPQPANAAPGEKGCGAHTDFGSITILMQDDVGGLQVWDHDAQQWIDGIPIPNAFIVNLGDLMARWTNDRYRSTIHRVINVSGRERYSVPFFFSGNPDHVVQCIDSCLEPGEEPKYPPATVDAHVRMRYAQTYR